MARPFALNRGLKLVPSEQTGAGELWEDVDRKRVTYFDSVSQRHLADIATDDQSFAYNVSGDLSTITSSRGVVTFGYTGDDLTSVTNPITGIDAVFGYTAGDLTSITYTDTL